MSDSECIFRSNLNNSRKSDDEIKYVSVYRKENAAFLDIRSYRLIDECYHPTPYGVSLSLSQTTAFFKLVRSKPSLSDLCYDNRFLSTPGNVHHLKDLWITVGKEIFLLRKKRSGVLGISLTMFEFMELEARLQILSYVMFPVPHDENVVMIQAMCFEISSLLSLLRKQKCDHCANANEEQGCMFNSLEKELQLLFKEATHHVDPARVLHCANYIQDTLQFSNIPPTPEDVKPFLKDYSWFVEEMGKGDSYYFLIRSFIDLHKPYFPSF